MTEIKAGPLNRRSLLVTGVALVVGSGATVIGETLSDPGPGKRLTPGESLMRDHGVLKRVLLVYRAASDRLANKESLPIAAVASGAKIIHDYIEGFHEGLEEAYVFQRLLFAGKETETVETLLVQHARGRQITTRIQQLTATSTSAQSAAARAQLKADLDAFVRMYEPHEAREDTVIFPTLRTIASAGTLRDLGERFQSLEDKQFGRAGFDDMVGAVAAAEELLGIDVLSSFTPPRTGL